MIALRRPGAKAAFLRRCQYFLQSFLASPAENDGGASPKDTFCYIVQMNVAHSACSERRPCGFTFDLGFDDQNCIPDLGYGYPDIQRFRRSSISAFARLSPRIQASKAGIGQFYVSDSPMLHRNQVFLTDCCARRVLSDLSILRHEPVRASRCIKPSARVQIQPVPVPPGKIYGCETAAEEEHVLRLIP